VPQPTTLPRAPIQDRRMMFLICLIFDINISYISFFFIYFLKNPGLGQMTGFPPLASGVQAPLVSLSVFLIEKYIFQ
jgi:hypothetical protein